MNKHATRIIVIVGATAGVVAVTALALWLANTAKSALENSTLANPTLT